MTNNVSMRVWRGDLGGGALQDFTFDVNQAEVVLDVTHRLQATQVPEPAVRRNCKAGNADPGRRRSTAAQR